MYWQYLITATFSITNDWHSRVYNQETISNFLSKKLFRSSKIRCRYSHTAPGEGTCKLVSSISNNIICSQWAAKTPNCSHIFEWNEVFEGLSLSSWNNNPANIYLLKVNNRNTWKKVSNMFTVNNKNTREVWMTSFWCSYCHL